MAVYRIENIVAEAQAFRAGLASELKAVNGFPAPGREQQDGVAVTFGFEELPNGGGPKRESE